MADMSYERMKEAARRFLVPFIRARGYLPQNLSAAKDEIRMALQEWESSKEYIPRETYDYVRTILIDIHNLLERQQVAEAVSKMEAIWAFMMTKAFGPPEKLPYIASPFPQGFPQEMKGSILKGSRVQIPTGSLELKNRFGNEFRNMILEAERGGKGEDEVGAMICQSPSGEFHLGRVCWGTKGEVHVTDCHDLKPYGSFHVHLHGSDVFSPQDLEQAIDREQISCIGYMEAGIPTLKCVTPRKYYDYTPEAKIEIHRALDKAAEDIRSIRRNPNSPEARRLAEGVRKKLYDIERLLDVYETHI